MKHRKSLSKNSISVTDNIYPIKLILKIFLQFLVQFNYAGIMLVLRGLRTLDVKNDFKKKNF